MSYYHYGAKFVLDTIFGSADALKKDTFGEYTSEAENELNRFNKEEDYLVALVSSFE